MARHKSVAEKKEQKRIALERITELFRRAKDVFNHSPGMSNRYVGIARKMAMKYTIRLPKEIKRQFCKHCYHYLFPGKNSRVRTKDGKVIYTCFNCNKYMRFLIK